MKRITAYLLILCTVLSLCACSKPAAEETIKYDGFINDTALQKSFEDALINEKGENVVVAISEASLLYPLSLDPFVSGMLSGAGSWLMKTLLDNLSTAMGLPDKLAMIYGRLEKLDEIMEQLDKIEDSVEALSRQIEDDRFKDFMGKRDQQITALTTADLPTLKAIMRINEEKPADAEEQIKQVLSTWAKIQVNSGSILYSIPTMLASFAGSYDSGMSVPEIYDRYAYRLYAWEHEGYDFREQCRLLDAVAMCQAYQLCEMYYSYNPDGLNAYQNEEAMKDLTAKMKTYSRLLEEHPVTVHEDFAICQLPGCQYAFYKKLKYLDYFQKGKEVLSGTCLEDDRKDTEAEEARKARMDDVFYNAYAYEDPALSVSFSMDAENIEEYLEPEDLKYISQNAYKVIYNYYNNGKKGDQVRSIYQIFKDELGYEDIIAENTSMVADRVSRYSTNGKNVTYDLVYRMAFRFKVWFFKQNTDYYNLTCVLNNDCSFNEDKTVAHRGNYQKNIMKINSYGTREKYIFTGFAIYKPLYAF